MSKVEPLSVEIFRDADRKRLPIGETMKGLYKINRITAGLNIVRATNLLSLAGKGQEYVDSRTVKWPDFEADINVVLTDKRLYTPDRTLAGASEVYFNTAAYTNGRAGLAIFRSGDREVNVALIDAGRSFGVKNAVTHEVAHLLGLEKNGATPDGNHCACENCIMQPRQVIDKEFLPSKRDKLEQFLEWTGFLSPGYATRNRLTTESFCNKCTDQLRENTYLLQMGKAARSITKSFV